ncbi:hypothetical protein CKY39_21280 [Variovorax boronicumulans]|uniref:Uncharacterized protein n=1 Tax=Variovorax boronicumulans TaxID=436515 RepID=A0A250DMJ5_9BURK|nr:hypothetical protein [Variovorax boronicumulans]ATA55474.1 hypothetical protein CKY39_21280 [Variovorax boronicumulans]
MAALLPSWRLAAQRFFSRFRLPRARATVPDAFRLMLGAVRLHVRTGATRLSYRAECPRAPTASGAAR